MIQKKRDLGYILLEAALSHDDLSVSLAVSDHLFSIGDCSIFD